MEQAPENAKLYGRAKQLEFDQQSQSQLDNAGDANNSQLLSQSVISNSGNFFLTADPHAQQSSHRLQSASVHAPGSETRPVSASDQLSRTRGIPFSIHLKDAPSGEKSVIVDVAQPILPTIEQLCESEDDMQYRLQSQAFELSSQVRKFHSELESCRTQLRIAKIEADAKQGLEARHQEINIEYLQKTLLRDLQQEDEKQAFFQMQLDQLQQENEMIRKVIHKFETRVRKIEEYIGV